MKKKIICILVFIMFLILLFSTTVSAKSIDANDVESRTYIIGEHMYTRDTNGDYNGKLTTQYIMLGASTINSKDIEEFVIYYKNPLGEWKNALTNQTIIAPESFDIKYINGEQTDKVQYGDVNEDGKINMTDVTLIDQYLKGYETPEDFNIANADVNGDGSVTEADVRLIIKYYVGYYPEANLPEEPLGKTYKIEFIVDGEIYIIDYELRGEEFVKPETPEKEGYKFDDWYLDEQYEKRFVGYKILEDITLYGKFNKIQYGDVTFDGIVDNKDLMRMQRHLEGEELMNSVENADVNGDGKFTIADYTLVKKYLLNYYPEANLPEEPLGKSYRIEYVFDDISCETYTIDYELEGKTLVAPDAPEKEGYIFDGWYLLASNENFEFGTTLVTGETIFYAKFVKLQYGDVYCDGRINDRDVTCIRRYLTGYELPKEVKIENADVNGDGKVTEADVVLLRKYLAGYYPECNLPDKPLGETYIIEYTVGEEIYIIDYELEGQILSINHRPEDPKKEGYIFDGWYICPEYTTEYKFEYDKTAITADLVLYGRFVKCGDVDQNGNVNVIDASYIPRYLIGEVIPSTVNISYGDVNEDGEVDDVDYMILSEYCAYAIDKLPYDSGEKYTITYNLDGGTVADDYNIKTYAQISLPYTLNTPSKEGYTFIGWTGSNGSTPQTKVTIEEGITGNLEYTANWELNN